MPVRPAAGSELETQGDQATTGYGRGSVVSQNLLLMRHRPAMGLAPEAIAMSYREKDCGRINPYPQSQHYRCHGTVLGLADWVRLGKKRQARDKRACSSAINTPIAGVAS
jgi:hypothetical protein